ncbi:hypothetical protein [Rhizobium esperanzae]|uniref:Uncharacterized protein n=1 Tax=Rhizobium esperanzae TaxID=1967781 RepID=A0A7W6R4G9_9HYPH|nr:hypothetical protein [Rhizobium esperanzae]MBB4236630.1 hypothetical protein [Rhizobium esperanzae]
MVILSAAMVFRLTSLPEISDCSLWETGWKYLTAVCVIASNTDIVRPLLATSTTSDDLGLPLPSEALAVAGEILGAASKQHLRPFPALHLLDFDLCFGGGDFAPMAVAV